MHHGLGLPVAKNILHPDTMSSGQSNHMGVTDYLTVWNPATGAETGFVPNNFSRNLLPAVAEAAERAQQIWQWEVQEQEKERVFRAMIAEFEAHKGTLARTMTLEGGKLWKWAVAEVEEKIDTLWHYHGEISRCHTNDGYARCQMEDKNAFSIRIPFGKILKISPWNFPLAVPMWAVSGALAGQNAILVKPAEQTPFTMQYAVEFMHRAIEKVIPGKAHDLRGLVQVIHGTGPGSGKLLVEEYDYDKATFTGSGEVGFMVASLAASRKKNGQPYGRPCHLELGGHAAMVVLDDFDVELAALEVVNAAFGDSGQRCVSTRVVFAAENIYKPLLARVVELARMRRVGHPMDQNTDMGPLISQEQLDRVTNMVDATRHEGHFPLLAGYPLNQKYAKAASLEGLNVDTTIFSSRGYYYSPTIFTEVPYGTTAMDKEIFGPVLVINPLPGKNREEQFWNAVALVNKSHYGLSNALLTNDRLFASRAPGRFRTGILYIGRGTTGAELNKYFGGVKASGWGREGRGLDDWTQVQQVYDDYHGKPRMAQAGSAGEVWRVFNNASSPLERR